jgi:methionyl-tRNA formyltransferase
LEKNGKKWSSLKMNIVFFGTPEYVLPVVEELNKKFKNRDGSSPIAAVVTQPPKPIGRKQIKTYSAVDNWAHKRGILVFYEPQDLLAAGGIGLELGVIADYGKIISRQVIDAFPRGILNIHFSSLPRFRGASPVQAALVNGDAQIGITIFKIDEDLDHGPILSQFEENVSEEETYGELKSRLFPLAARVLCELLPAYVSGKIKLKTQKHSDATYTRQIVKKDGFIPAKYINLAQQGKVARQKWQIDFIKDLELVPNAQNLYNFIRAMAPWPGAWTNVKIGGMDKRLKILKVSKEGEKLILEQVQLEGKNPVSWIQFGQAYKEAVFE